jgi:hypothetical protein
MIVLIMLINRLKPAMEGRCRKYHYKQAGSNSLTIFAAHVDDQGEGVPHTDWPPNPCT